MPLFLIVFNKLFDLEPHTFKQGEETFSHLMKTFIKNEMGIAL